MIGCFLRTSALALPSASADVELVCGDVGVASLITAIIPMCNASLTLGVFIKREIGEAIIVGNPILE